MKKINKWFSESKDDHTHMLVVCDTFDHGDYPVYVREGQDVQKVFDAYNSMPMQRVMEVYNLGKDKDKQLKKKTNLEF